MRHLLLTHHPVLAPLLVLGASWTPVAVMAPADARWLVFAFAANGVITVLAAWLLLRQYIGHLVMGGRSFDAAAAEIRALVTRVDHERDEDRVRLHDHEEQLEEQAKDIRRIREHPLLRAGSVGG